MCRARFDGLGSPLKNLHPKKPPNYSADHVAIEEVSPLSREGVSAILMVFDNRECSRVVRAESESTGV